ncbi:DNA polymerase [Gemmatimonadota bacterium]
MEIISEIKKLNIPVRTVTPTEYSSPCPFCNEGEDRFKIWSEQGRGNRGRYWCRKCEKKGDLINFFQDYYGLTKSEAYLKAGIDPDAQSTHEYKSENSAQQTSSRKFIDQNLWHKQAKSLVKSAQTHLQNNQDALAQLSERGLKPEIITRANLGWHPEMKWVTRSSWGLEEEIDENGKPVNIHIPEGLVIPCLREGLLTSIKIRRAEQYNGNKYKILPGSIMKPMVMITDKQLPVIIVESELDALLVHQETSDFVNVIGLGSAYTKPDEETVALLHQSPLILGSLDMDEAGGKETWHWWNKNYPSMKRWPVPTGKDPGEALQNGLNIRLWIKAALQKYQKIFSLNTPTIPNLPQSAPAETTNKNTSYLLVPHEKTLHESLAPILKSKTVGISTITTGTDPYKDSISFILLSIKDHPVVAIDFQALGNDLSVLHTLFKSKVIKIFHDGKNDLKFMYKAGFKVNGPLFDTMLASQIIKAGIRESNYNIEELIQTYLKEEITEEKDSDGNSSDCCLEYQARLATALPVLREKLKEELVKNSLRKVAQLEFGCMPVVAEMELNGMGLDVDKWNELGGKLSAKFEKLDKIVQEQLGPVKNPDDLKRSLDQLGITVPNTRKNTLAQYVSEHTIIKDILTWKKFKTAKEKTERFKQYIHPVTSRFHPHFKQLGTVTGRFTCNNPSLQNIPKDQQFRSCFTAPTGKLLVIGDYSQMELRVAAEITNDEKMIEAFQQGLDIHRQTAALLTGKTLDAVTDDERSAAKAVNFGVIFGMGAKALSASARTDYGVDMKVEHAKVHLERFFNVYSGLNDWKNKVAHSGITETRTLINRRRLWEGKAPVTEALNSPVQGTAADIIKYALILLSKRLEEISAKIANCIHDEIVLEVSDSRAEEVARSLEKSMVQAGEYFLKKVPVKVQVVIGDNWAAK